MIVPILNNVLFVFVDSVSKGQFQETTESGITIVSDRKRSAEKTRWAKVLAVGPNCKEVEKGDVICIEPLMWSLGFKHDGVEIWKTDETKVMCVDHGVA